MKSGYLIAGLLLTTILACTDEKKQSDSNQKEPITQADKQAKRYLENQANAESGVDNTISFVIGGEEEVNLKADVMLNEINGKQTLAIGTGALGNTKHLLVINWDEPEESAQSFDEKGKYGHPKAEYSPDIIKDIKNTYLFKNGGVFDVTSLDLKKGGHISATFEGAAINKEGHLISISNGKINNAKIQGGVFTTK